MATPFTLRSLIAILACAWLPGMTSAAAADTQAQTQEPAARTARKPVINSAQLLYHMLLGEIAYARARVAYAEGSNTAAEANFSVALSNYAELSKRTDDPRIISRTNEIGMANALINAQSHPAETEALLKTRLANPDTPREILLQQLPAIFSRNADKTEVARIISRLTAPYLGLAEAQQARAVAELQASHNAAARTAAEAALALRPDLEQAALIVAQTASPAEHDAAMETLGAFAKAHPQALESRLTYTEWLARQGRKEDAAIQYNALLKDNPTNDPLAFAVIRLAVQVEDLETAQTLLERLIEHNWGEADRLRALLGEVQEQRGLTDKALLTYDQVEPGSLFLTAQLHKAQILARQKQYSAALAGLEAAIRRSPADAVGLQIAQSQLLRRNGKLDAAHDVLQAILTRNPDNQDALYDAAMIDEQMGKTGPMEERLRRILTLKPDHSNALNALGYSFAERNTHLDEADSLLTQALKLEPENPAFLDSLGWLRFRQGKLAEARDLLQRAYAKLPDPEVAGHLVEVLWVDNQHDAARRLMTEATKASPDEKSLQTLAKRLGM